MRVLCQVFLQISSCSHGIRKGILMNSRELRPSMLPFFDLQRFLVQVPDGAEIEHQKKHLADLSEIDHTENSFRRDHEGVVDDHISQYDQAVCHQPQINRDKQQNDGQRISKDKERPIGIEQGRNCIVEPLVGKKAMEDEVHRMIVGGTKKGCHVDDEKEFEQPCILCRENPKQGNTLVHDGFSPESSPILPYAGQGRTPLVRTETRIQCKNLGCLPDPLHGVCLKTAFTRLSTGEYGFSALVRTEGWAIRRGTPAGHPQDSLQAPSHSQGTAAR